MTTTAVASWEIEISRACDQLAAGSTEAEIQQELEELFVFGDPETESELPMVFDALFQAIEDFGCN